MIAFAVIPSIGASPYLQALLDLLAAEDIQAVVVNNAPGAPRTFVAPPTWYVRAPWGIYRTWNYGIDTADGWEVPCLVLNDDICLRPGDATVMVDWLTRGEWAILGFDYKYLIPHPVAPIAVTGTYRQGGVGGFAFGVDPRLCARVDEAFRWYGGDDDLVEATLAKGGRVGILSGCPVEHPEPGLTARARPELLPEGWEQHDRDLLRAKWGSSW